MNWKNICKTVFALFAFLFFIGCQSMYLPSRKTEESQADSEHYINEVAQNEMPKVIVEEKRPGTEQSDDENVDIFSESHSSGDSDRKYMQGWRVQLITTTDKKEADSLVAHFERELEMKVYRPYEPPYFKLRVGNCEKEQDAKELLDEVTKVKGLSDAWIVRDRIIKQE
ncbi:MAG: SPOR domain-containing protein [Candidatus Zixiibacteriota bacterium]